MSTIELQSQDHRDLLDLIDRLRSLGVTRYLDLPQIIVCGDQSAGKSSVLEAISGLPFPTKDNLCTRFATELILRRDETPGVTVAIIPGPDRSQQEIEQLSSFRYQVTDLKPDLACVVEEAKQIMGLSEVQVFSNDILRVELQGPDQPHLTLVDLPGLFRASNRDQSAVDGAPIVQQLVRSYMEQPRSIILAVVSAQSDFALQPITELSREVDPSGMRTLGLITKPDTLPRGSDSEASYIALAQNRDVIFRLGWHVLRNRSFETRNTSSTERDSDERRFFATGAWARLDRSTVGVQTLRTRLSEVLKNSILQQLPSLLRDASLGLEECQRRLGRLGEPRGTLTEQRRYLRQVSWSFSLLMKAAVDGFYSDVFFGQASTEVGYQKRIRAVVQNELESFAEVMRHQGRAQIIDDDSEDDGDDSSVPRTSRNSYLSHVQDLMRRSRGCELPGTFNPLLVGELFREQSRPWKRIAASAQEAIIKAIRRATDMILDSIAVPELVSPLSMRMNRTIDALVTGLEIKTNEMLRPHLSGHPITYNHYLTDTVQKIQSERRRRGGVEVNMNTYASQLATDYMQAYYKVAMKRFVDDLSVLAIEEELMQRLPRIFDTDAVDNLSDSDVAILAAESEATVSDRIHNREKLTLLDTTLHELRQFQDHRINMSDDDTKSLRLETRDLDHGTWPASGDGPSRTPISPAPSVEVAEPEEQPTPVPFDPWSIGNPKKGKKRGKIMRRPSSGQSN